MITRKTIKVNDNTNVLLEVINARDIKLTSTSSNIHTITRNKKIAKLIIDDTIVFNLDSEINDINFYITETFDAIYNPKQIKHTEIPTQFILSTYRYNICNYFVPVLLKFTKEDIQWNRFFVNSFITKYATDGILSSEVPTIGILLRYFPLEAWLEVERRIMCHKAYINSYRWDSQHILFTFQVQDEEEANYNTLLQSKYSKLTRSFKEEVLKFHNFTKDGEMAKILYKHESRRKQLQMELNVEYISTKLELFEKINADKEIVHINNNIIVK